MTEASYGEPLFEEMLINKELSYFNEGPQDLSFLAADDALPLFPIFLLLLSFMPQPFMNPSLPSLLPISGKKTMILDSQVHGDHGWVSIAFSPIFYFSKTTKFFLF